MMLSRIILMRLRPYRAAVDTQDLPGDETGGGRDQPAGGAGDVFGRAPALQRRFPFHPLLPAVGGALAPSGANPPWREAIDSDHGGQINGQAFGEGHDRSLAGAE